MKDSKIEVKNCSSILRDPLPLVRYDGTGLKADGEYCVFYEALAGCHLDIVEYDGVGFKRYYTTRPVGQDCPTVNAVVYDGTGLKVSVESMTCTV